MESLRYPLTARTVHLCIDMQRIFSEDGIWPTPWIERVLPVVTELAARHPRRTVFTRFITPARPEDMPGLWQRYYRRWRSATRNELDPHSRVMVRQASDFESSQAAVSHIACEQQAIQPAEKIILLGRATVRTGARKSEPLLFLNEMNILSALRSSNPICPGMQSVSGTCRGAMHSSIGPHRARGRHLQ